MSSSRPHEGSRAGAGQDWHVVYGSYMIIQSRIFTKPSTAVKQALLDLGYSDVYHMTNILTQNPRDTEMWTRAFDAIYGGEGTFRREEWDQLLGHCMVINTPILLRFASIDICTGCDRHTMRRVHPRTHRSISGSESGPADPRHRLVV